jgi:hypothetical protein
MRNSKLNVIHVHALKMNSHNPTNAPMLKLCFLHTICCNSACYDVLSIILRELLNIISVFNNPSMFLYTQWWCSVTRRGLSRQIEIRWSYEKLCVKSVMSTLVHLLVFIVWIISCCRRCWKWCPSKCTLYIFKCDCNSLQEIVKLWRENFVQALARHTLPIQLSQKPTSHQMKSG